MTYDEAIQTLFKWRMWQKEQIAALEKRVYALEKKNAELECEIKDLWTAHVSGIGTGDPRMLEETIA